MIHTIRITLSRFPSFYIDNQPVAYNAKTFCRRNLGDGNYQFPQECSKFVTRSNEKPHVTECPDNLQFNPTKNYCDYPLNVRCLELQGSVCYGAKGDSFGIFTIKRGGALRQLTLEHKSGYVSCDVNNPNAKSNWGCGVGFLSVRMGTVVTRRNNSLLFPFFKLSEKGYYGLARTDTFSRLLTLYNFDKSIRVWKGETIRLWHGEDLVKKNQQDNGGKHCVNAWAIIEQV